MKEDGLQKMLRVTVYASLLIQILTGVLDIYVLYLPSVNSSLAILKKLLGVEIAVQVVEGIFYGWFASSFEHVENVTPSRYYDWAITTPSMLFTLCIYLDFLNQRNAQAKSKKTYHTLVESFQKNRAIIIPVLLLNWMMLFFGYLGEMKVLPTTWSVGLGFIPFVLYFAMIYQQYAKYTVTGQTLFWSFSVIWALYGIAALMSYYVKNIAYNVLDLFAKNFFGLFLAYVVYQEYKLMV
jgi:bacteriorhodopsin